MVDSKISTQRCNPICNGINNYLLKMLTLKGQHSLAYNSVMCKQLFTQDLVIPDTALSKPVNHAHSRH